jgi:hypothetical protein
MSPVRLFVLVSFCLSGTKVPQDEINAQEDQSCWPYEIQERQQRGNQKNPKQQEYPGGNKRPCHFPLPVRQQADQSKSKTGSLSYCVVSRRPTKF